MMIILFAAGFSFRGAGCKRRERWEMETEWRIARTNLGYGLEAEVGTRLEPQEAIRLGNRDELQQSNAQEGSRKHHLWRWTLSSLARSVPTKYLGRGQGSGWGNSLTASKEGEGGQEGFSHPPGLFLPVQIPRATRRDGASAQPFPPSTGELT
jgi:hypothetical protein